jgi:sporulation protein YlmC with PRC-barrel domain
MFRKALLTAAALTALATAPVALQAQTTSTTQNATRGVQIDASHLRAKQLMDRDVYSTDNVEIGEIEDLIVDPANGRVVNAIIEIETRLGFTSKYVAVPMNQLKLTPGERRVTVNMTRDQLRELPGVNYND